MRPAPSLILVFCATLLIIFTGFSLFALVSTSVGTGIAIVGLLVKRKLVGFIGFSFMALGTSGINSSLDLTVLSNLLVAGILLILPLSVSLWIILTIGSYRDEKVRTDLISYTMATIFASIVLLSVPITGYIFHATRFATDVGAENEIMMLAFATAICAVAIFGFESRTE
jgi:hypothetical protein